MVAKSAEPSGTTTWAGGRMRRAPAGRHRVVYVRVTDSELSELRRRASLAGVSPPRYLLEQGLVGSRVTAADRRRRISEFTSVQAQLGRLVVSMEALVAAVSDGALPLGAAEAIAGTHRLRRDVAEALDRLMDGLGGFA